MMPLGEELELLWNYPLFKISIERRQTMYISSIVNTLMFVYVEQTEYFNLHVMGTITQS